MSSREPLLINAVGWSRWRLWASMAWQSFRHPWRQTVHINGCPRGIVHRDVDGLLAIIAELVRQNDALRGELEEETKQLRDAMDKPEVFKARLLETDEAIAIDMPHWGAALLATNLIRSLGDAPNGVAIAFDPPSGGGPIEVEVRRPTGRTCAATIAELRAEVDRLKATAFQSRVGDWMARCFDDATATDKIERCYRFLEEALELVQAVGVTADDCRRLVDYTFGRPPGDQFQEVGGVMVTLAALCNAVGHDIKMASESELERVWGKIDAIRLKHQTKPHGSPLPGQSEVPA